MIIISGFWGFGTQSIEEPSEGLDRESTNQLSTQADSSVGTKHSVASGSDGHAETLQC